MKDIVSVILAAGEGKRMKSKTPKVLHKLCGKPMIEYVLDTLNKLRIKRKVIVIGVGAEEVKKHLGNKFEYVLQKKQLGTAHALMQTKKLFENYKGDLLVLYGDVPLLSTNLLRTLIQTHKKKKAQATLISAILENPFGYGRIIRDTDRNRKIIKIVEEKDANLEERKIKEINAGIYCFNAQILLKALKEVKNKNKQGEYYLTDVISWMRNKNLVIEIVIAQNPQETLGINNRIELEEISGIIREEILNELMLSGVSIFDKKTTFIEKEVKIGKDTVIYPFTIIEGKTTIGEDCEIGPMVRIKDSKIFNGVKISNSVIFESVVKNKSSIGPFSHLRPDSEIGEEVKIGNFVEIKKTKIGKKSFVSHLTYLGDAEVGENVNVGAGTITCNFDGQKKHKTIIKKGAFIGSDSILVAPLTIGKDSYTAAGSTITKDVPDEALGISREKQKNILNWLKRRKKRNG